MTRSGVFVFRTGIQTEILKEMDAMIKEEK